MRLLGSQQIYNIWAPIQTDVGDRRDRRRETLNRLLYSTRLTCYSKYGRLLLAPWLWRSCMLVGDKVMLGNVVRRHCWSCRFINCATCTYKVPSLWKHNTYIQSEKRLLSTNTILYFDSPLLRIAYTLFTHFLMQFHLAYIALPIDAEYIQQILLPYTTICVHRLFFT